MTDNSSNHMKYLNQFCYACKKDFNMEVVSKNAKDDYFWCQCPECKGISPYKFLKDQNEDKLPEGLQSESKSDSDPV